jgi:hypothetical protein
VTHRPGSVQKEYDFYVSCDPAFAPPPAVPADGATEEEIAAFKTAALDYIAKWKSARETTNYAGLAIDGKSPVKFVLGQVKSKIWRAIHDRGTLPKDSPMHLGNSSVMALMTRLALRAIPSKDIKIVLERDPEWHGWEMAPESLIDELDEQNPRIVGEIGSEVMRRLQQGAVSGAGFLF